PPTTTLFPYTTLFRSRHEADHPLGRGHLRVLANSADVVAFDRADRGKPLALRFLDRNAGCALGGDLTEAPAAVDQRRRSALAEQDRKSTRLNSSHDQI